MMDKGHCLNIAGEEQYHPKDKPDHTVFSIHRENSLTMPDTRDKDQGKQHNDAASKTVGGNHHTVIHRHEENARTAHNRKK
jgi:hypothetical protein